MVNFHTKVERFLVDYREMDNFSSSLRNVARQLLAVEAAKLPSQPPGGAAARVCESFRLALTRFAGADGFTSLLKRAVALAQAELPELQRISVSSSGSLEGLERLANGDWKPDSGWDGESEAAVAVTAQLLGLLVTFIGRSLTLRLVRESWPDASLDELQ